MHKCTMYELPFCPQSCLITLIVVWKEFRCQNVRVSLVQHHGQWLIQTLVGHPVSQAEALLRTYIPKQTWNLEIESSCCHTARSCFLFSMQSGFKSALMLTLKQSLDQNRSLMSGANSALHSDILYEHVGYISHCCWQWAIWVESFKPARTHFHRCR